MEANEQKSQAVTVRPLRESDLPVADQVMRLAFGTFLGLSPPTRFMGDAGYVRTRFATDPEAAFAAEVNGELIGTNFATNWGSVGYFGPLTVRPDYWDRGVAQKLLEATMGRFEGWGIRHAGLFTFAQSPRHVALYQKFGFWARFLTAIMTKPIARASGVAPPATFSAVPEGQRDAVLASCRALMSAIYDGLDVTLEILAVDRLGLGETVLVTDGGDLVALAVCHLGPDTEAGSGTCFVKFGAVGPGLDAARHFGRLLDACEQLAASRGLARLTCGGNMGRIEACRTLVARGHRTELQGVAMHRHNEEGYNRPGVYVIDDWR